MVLDDIDLAELTQSLRAHLPEGEPIGYLRGKALLRDVVEKLLGCSDVEAEDLVDTLEMRGYLQFKGDPSERSYAESHWAIDPGAEV